MSPVAHISKATAPVYIIHGEKDPIVPLFQAEAFGEKTKSNEVSFELYVKSGAKHGWKNMLQDESKFVAWVDKYLLNY